MAVKKFDDPITAMKAISELRRRTVDVPIEDGFTVTLRTLGTKSETDTFVNCMSLWGQAFLYKHKIETLISAITHINGLPLDSVSDVDKRSIIESWSQDLVDDLYIAYAKLVGAVDEFFEKIKLTAETNVIGAKEVLEKQKTIESDANKAENVK